MILHSSVEFHLINKQVKIQQGILLEECGQCEGAAALDRMTRESFSDKMTLGQKIDESKGENDVNIEVTR